MLILTRKKDESLVIDGKIEIRIVSLDDGKVKLGIEAPREVEIHRKEIFEKIQIENKEAILKEASLNDLKKFIKKE